MYTPDPQAFQDVWARVGQQLKFAPVTDPVFNGVTKATKQEHSDAVQPELNEVITVSVFVSVSGGGGGDLGEHFGFVGGGVDDIGAGVQGALGIHFIILRIINIIFVGCHRFRLYGWKMSTFSKRLQEIKFII